MDPDIIQLDLSNVDRDRLASIANAAFSMLCMDDVLAILHAHGIRLVPVSLDEVRAN